MNNYTCHLCKSSINLNENLSGLVVNDEHFICESCCSNNPKDKLTKFILELANSPSDFQPICAWLDSGGENKKLFMDFKSRNKLSAVDSASKITSKFVNSPDYIEAKKIISNKTPASQNVRDANLGGVSINTASLSSSVNSKLSFYKNMLSQGKISQAEFDSIVKYWNFVDND